MNVRIRNCKYLHVFMVILWKDILFPEKKKKMRGKICKIEIICKAVKKSKNSLGS